MAPTETEHVCDEQNENRWKLLEVCSDVKCNDQESLIEKYFQDQMQRDSLHKESGKRIDRKTYQRLYKRLQRKSNNFKTKERDEKRQAREDDDQKVKDRLSTSKSKRKARKSIGFKKQERDA
jgi:hypothetical protein